MTGTSSGIFLSYASQDAEPARRICEALRAAGIEVWFDQSELRGGDVWDRNIRQQIRDCALFIPIISARSQERLEGYFRREWKMAVERMRDMADRLAFLVPVVIDDTGDREAEVPDEFRQVQWTRLLDGVTPAAFTERVAALMAAKSTSNRPNRPAPPLDAAPSPAKSPPSQSKPRPTWIWALAAVIPLATLAIGYFALHGAPNNPQGQAAQPTTPTTQAGAPAQTAIPEKSIAVLPFVDMSEKKDQEYFSDGLSEEVIDHLANSPDLKVIARTSSFQFKGKNEDVRSIAAKLGVANLLEGSVRKSGQELRITVQLIRASDGTHIWSQTYDRGMEDIFKVQDEIAGTVAQALNAALNRGPSGAGQEANTEAYTLFLKGNFFYERQTQGDSLRAIEQYQEAVKLDPNYALAWAKIGRAYVAGRDDSLSLSERESKARDALQHALAIDPNSAPAHRWLGRVLNNFDGDWAAGQRELERAAALDPNGTEGNLALADLTILKGFYTGQCEPAVQLVLAEVARNPLDGLTLNVLGWLHRFAGQLDASAATYRRLLELNPSFIGAHSGYAETLLQMGSATDALAEAQKEPSEESRLAILAPIYWSLGRRSDSDAALHQLESKFADSSSFDIAAAYAYRGDSNTAFMWLERTHQKRKSSLLLLRVEPLLAKLRGDPRYEALVKRMNFP
jgi:TolB-like protein